MKSLNILLIVLCAIFSELVLVCQVSSAVSQPPNIIFMLADDLGWDDVGFHGSEIKTPNIDRLAREGIILNNYYVQPVCTPTRSAILTSKYPIHTGLQVGVIHGGQAYGMPLNLTTLPQRLKKYGYDTHAIGKWHLGFLSKDYIPENRGFDSFLGFYNGHEDYFDHHIHFGNFEGLDFHYKQQPLWNYSEIYSTEIFANRAKSIIESHNKSKPLFMYFAHQAVHAADSNDVLQAPQKNIDRFHYITDLKRKYFAGAVSAIDDSLGVLHQSLVDAGMADNTVIVFSTDNGGPANGREGNAACNWPLRGSKGTLWQGGVHAVGFVHSPLLRRKGYVSESLIHATDWLPTFLSLAANGSNDLKGSLDDLDGIDQWNVLSFNTETKRKEVLLNINPHARNEAIIVGDFKLIKGQTQKGKYDGWYPPPQHKKPFINKPFNGLGCTGFFCPGHRRSPNIYQPKQWGISMNGNVEVKGGNDEVNQRHLDRLIAWMNKEYEQLKQRSSLLVSHTLRASSHYDFPPEKDLREMSSSHMDGVVSVNCGPKPANASTNCDVKHEACLFHIKNDPCEYMNLAHLLPEITQKLLDRVNIYRKSMVRPLNKPVDPRSNPALHGGVWMPWL